MKTDACVIETPQAPSPAIHKLAAPNFDRLALVYRWMEWLSFGPFLWWCRCTFMNEMRGRRRALVIGDGDGRFTARLLAENGGIQVEAVDASSAMLQALAGRARRADGRLKTICMDARDWQPQSAASCDLVVTHFFLDCLTTEEVGALARSVRGAVEPDAIWVVSEFAIPATRFGRWLARPLVWALYWAFDLLTGLQLRQLPGHQAALREAGFQLRQRRTLLGGLLASEMWRPDPAA